MRDTMFGDGKLFQPDTLLPAQFFAHMRKRVPKEPEYRLAVAVLQDAIECFQKHLLARDSKSRQLFEDAEAWIMADERSWPLSFVNICDLLGINVEYVRRGLTEWRERELHAHRGRVVEIESARTKAGERRVAAKAS
jgi:hypothetical protein